MVEDLITLLADDILISIISHLSLKEAIRTSVLSRRWRKLWKFTSRLDFNIGKVDLKRSRFIDWVYSVLESHQATSLDEFTLFFDLGEKNSKDHIDSWLTLALERRVQRLHLNVNTWGYRYTLSTQFLHSHSLDSITVIHLKNVQVTGDFVDHILGLCPFLEVLSVKSAISLDRLKIFGPLLKLKHLEIISCNFVKYVEISAKNLVSFKYHGRCARVIIYDAPCLVEASVWGDCAYYFLKNMSQFSNYLSRLETFELDLTSIQKIGSNPKFPELRNLKQLDLAIYVYDAYNLLCCSSFLLMSPFLHRLKIKFSHTMSFFSSTRSKMKVRKAEPHRYLKVVELGGFLGFAIYVELAQHLLKRAVSLEKLIIDSCTYSMEDRAERTDPKSILAARARARARHLQKSLPPKAELVIL